MSALSFASLESPLKGLEHGRRAIQTALGKLAREVIGDPAAIVQILREDFQSEVFQQAGFSRMPGSYGSFDQSLFTLDFADGKKVAVVIGKISSENPFDVGHAAGGGFDLRRTQIAVYIDHGRGTLLEIVPGQKRNIYDGDNGHMEALLPYARQSLGTLVSSQTLDRD